MRPSISRRLLLLLPLASAALYGCPPAETADPADEYADVIYGGGATDEAMVSLGSALDQKDPIADPARAPVLDTPVETALPKGTIADFTWHFGDAASQRSPLPGRPVHAAADGPARRSLAGVAKGWLGPLAELTGPPRAAHAHGDPLSGPATLLVFSTKTNPKLVRVFTDQTSFVPGQETWDTLAAAGEEITLSLVAAEFDANRIADGGDPVQGTQFTFTITP
jgi:hypothetical protein